MQRTTCHHCKFSRMSLHEDDMLIPPSKEQLLRFCLRRMKQVLILRNCTHNMSTHTRYTHKRIYTQAHVHKHATELKSADLKLNRNQFVQSCCEVPGVLKPTWQLLSRRKAHGQGTPRRGMPAPVPSTPSYSISPVANCTVPTSLQTLRGRQTLIPTLRLTQTSL